MTKLERTYNDDLPVLVIGAAGVDVVGHTDFELQPSSSNPAKIRFSFGGVARNVAENLSRLGQTVKLVTAVGSGYFGDQLLKQISNAGVDTTLSLQTDSPTGSYISVQTAGGARMALDDMRAISSLTPGYLRSIYQEFKNASIIFVDANLPEPALKTVFSLARRVHKPVIADPTSVILAPKLIPFLSQLKMITPNSAEAAIYCESNIKDTDQNKAIEAVKNLVSKGVDIAIITLAEFGVCYATSESSGYIPAIRTEIIDPTGAGDALTATVIFSMLNNIPLDDGIRLGVSAASHTLRHRGAVLPDLTLEKLYDQLLI